MSGMRSAVWAIVRKDLRVVTQSKPVLLPLVLVPLILLVGLPLLAAAAPSMINLPGTNDVASLLALLPPEMQARFQGASEEAIVVELLLSYLFAPLYLIVPLMTVSVIAADAFAGEKERGTLEALLYTPTRDRTLLLAKALAAYVPALATAWGGFIVYAVMANLAAWPVLGRVFFPTPVWWVLAGWVAPAVAALGLGATVAVSARVHTFQEAYQLSAVVVLPIVAILVGQATGVVVLSPAFAWILGAGAWLLALVTGGWSARSFSRNRLMARE